MENSTLDRILDVVIDLQSDVKDLKVDVKDLKADVKDLKQRVGWLEQGQTKLEQGLVKLEAKVDAGFEDMNLTIGGVVAHQNEDYKLLQEVNDKVTLLTNISQVHEQKFEKLQAV